MSDKPVILLVDDEPDLLQSLVGLLRREFQVHTAASGEEALPILAEHPIEVLMTDQRMPQMTGSTLLAQAAARRPAITRILFTGYADIKSVIDAINTGGVYRYLTKPWDPDELIELLRRAVREHRREVAAVQVNEQARQLAAQGRRVAEHLRSGAYEVPDLDEFIQAIELVEYLLAESNLAGKGD
jgi:DNA-binding NtrC family response regulator